jgi:hypothetical protein
MGRTSNQRLRVAASALLIASLLLGWFEPAGATEDPVLVATGDISTCDSSADSATARLADQVPGTVATLGDSRYGKAKCYDQSWGGLRGRIRPAIGNHDVEHGSWYYNYFGGVAGPAGMGYYSYDVGAWHIVVLNSNCTKVGGCGPDSVQTQWLQADLAASSAQCTLAYWHHPRFSSDKSYGNDRDMGDFWDVLYEAGADVVLNGHAHVYERFAPQTPGAERDDASGIRQFTVGTGGASHYRFAGPQPNSEVRNNKTFGVLELTLHDGSYDWEFLPQAGKKFTDSGTTDCH